MFKMLLCGLLMGGIVMCWYLANIFSKPVLNRMSNYYEDDKDGRAIANILIAACILLSVWLGHIMF